MKQWINPLVLVKHIDDIAVVLATFAFTMLGFMAAMITILFSFAKSRTFRKYSQKGNLKLFFKIYYLTIFSLVLTFALSLICYGTGTAGWALPFSLASTVNNLCQISLLTIIIINLSNRASSEPLIVRKSP